MMKRIYQIRKILKKKYIIIIVIILISCIRLSGRYRTNCSEEVYLVLHILNNVIMEKYDELDKEIMNESTRILYISCYLHNREWEEKRKKAGLYGYIKDKVKKLK
ncbi:MAG: hypothetical protein KatS3mg129_2312 [Leptospiraceae bacterium]|nr:MAG: hypothetical protein KatS3mg129_2312 [Leptospiraceae bacterium]